MARARSLVVASLAIGAGASLGMASLLSCGGKVPETVGIRGSALSPCPVHPNCVSSDATAEAQKVAPLRLSVPPEQAWRAVRTAVSRLPRTKIVADTAEYLHAECRSRFFRFVDDLELQLRPGEGQIGVRSGARLGYSDFGVNRERVETLRRMLVSAGVVQP